MKRKLIIRPLIIIVLLLLFFATHEATHYIIFDAFDCEDINFGWSKYSIYTNANLNSCSYPEYMLLAQSINEVVGYSIIPFMILISFILIELWDNSVKLK